MNIQHLSTPTTATGLPQATERANAPAASPGFSQALKEAQQAPEAGKRILVERGDTLRALVRAHAPGPLNEQQLRQGVAAVARANGLSDPNLILAGQHLRMPNLLTPTPLLTTTITTNSALPRSSQANPLLAKTLDRAVDKGYIRPQEKALVEQGILSLGQRHGFKPDDFARVALMESDGLNPKASNGRCHGIIQFCEGMARGADSVGLRGRAHEIAQMSVPQQLKLVDLYLTDVGVRRPSSTAHPNQAPQAVALDDLYLAVLTPSARSEPSANVALNIAGDQARALYVNSDRDQAITRQSLTQGLQRHASRVLNQHQSQSGNAVANERQLLAARNSYVDVAVLSGSAAKTRLTQP